MPNEFDCQKRLNSSPAETTRPVVLLAWIGEVDLRHSNVAFTMAVYQHVLPSLGKQAADAVQDTLGDVIEAR